MKATLKALVTQRTLTVLACFIAVVGIASFMAYREGVQQKVNPSSAASCTVSATLVNSCRPWLGAWAKDYPQVPAGVKNQISYHEQRIGKQVDLVKDYKTEGNTLSADDKYFIDRANTYAVVTWKPANTFAAGAGSNAQVNSDIDKMADSIKSVAPHKVFLSVWHEPENDVSSGAGSCSANIYKSNTAGNTPANYRAMWQNVRNRFNAKGVNNVVWTLIPMGFNGFDCMDRDLWPGNNLVDWIMWDPYGQSDKSTWTGQIGQHYNWMLQNSDATHDFTSKPWGLAEVSTHLSSKAASAAWWQQAKTALDNNTFPRLKAYIVFDSDNGKPDNRIMYWCDPTAAGQPANADGKGNCGNLQIDNNEQAAYKAFANDPIFSSGTTSPGGGGGGDTQKPTVSLTSPAGGATVSGNVTASANASDNVAVTKVAFTVDGRVVYTDTAAPYSMALDTTLYSNGTHAVAAVAYDAAGNTTTAQVNVTMKNTTPPPPPAQDTTAPVASIAAPANNATVSGVVAFTADATDNVAVAKVMFTVDGNPIATDMTKPYSISLDTTKFSNGNHVIRAKAYDAAGNAKTPQKSITIRNVASFPPAPVITSFSASPATIVAGDRTTLNWQTSGGTVNCSVSPDGYQHTILNSWTTMPLAAAGTYNYLLTCYNSAGATTTARTTVRVNPAQIPPSKPVVTANKSWVEKGGNVLIYWQSENATSCTIGNTVFSGNTGSKLFTNLQATTTFTVTCFNNAGFAANSVKVPVVVVDPPATNPVIASFTASQSTASIGARVLLRWTTTNVAANGCSLQPSPLSSAPANGDWLTPRLLRSVSYTLTCKDAKGHTVSKSLGITVNGGHLPLSPPAIAPEPTAITTVTVRSLGGQPVVNAQAKAMVTQGQLVTLDPSNVTDAKKAAHIVRVEYYDGSKLVQTVDASPYALNSTNMKLASYNLTERTYYDDGSDSELTESVALVAPTTAGNEPSPVVLTVIFTAAGVLMLSGVFVMRRSLLHHLAPASHGWAPGTGPHLSKQEDKDDDFPFGGPTVG